MTGIKLVIDVMDKLIAGLNKASAVVDKFKTDTQRKLDSIKLNDPTRGMGKPSSSTFSMGNLDAKGLEKVKTLKEEVPHLDRALDLAGNTFKFVAAGAVAMAIAFGGATMVAAEWQKGMAKVNVTAGLSKEELGGLSDKLRSIGRDAPVDMMQVPEAFNKIISAGLDVTTSLKVLPLALKASKAGFVDVELAASSAVGVMNASGRDINDVYNILFATLNKGNAEFSDVANYLPKIIPASRALGLSLEQTAGAWSYLTAQGLKSEQATVGLQNLMKAFSDVKTLKNLSKAKIEIFDSKGAMKGFDDIAAQLQTKLAGLSDAKRISFLDGLGLDTEASMALGMMVSNVKALKDTIGFVGNGADHMNKAFYDSATTMDLMMPILNNIKDNMISVGQVGLSIIKPVLTWMHRNLSDIGLAVKAIATGVSIATGLWAIQKYGLIAYNFVLAATNGLITSQNILLTIMNSLNPFAWVGLAIAGLVILYNKCDEARAIMDGIWSAGTKAFNLWWEGVKNIFSGFKTMITGIGTILQNTLQFNKAGIQRGLAEFGVGLKQTISGAVDASAIGLVVNGKKIVNAGMDGYGASKLATEKKALLTELEGLKSNDHRTRQENYRMQYLMANLKQNNADAANGGAIPPVDGKPVGGVNFSDKVKSSQDSISSSSKSIVIQNLKFQDNLNVSATLTKGTTNDDIEGVITETLMKVVRNLETMLN